MQDSLVSMVDSEVAVKVMAIKVKADAIIVKDQASYDAADAINKAARDEKKAFHEWFDPIDDASKKQRQATICQLKAIDDPLDYVIQATGSKQAAWYRAEQLRIAAEQRQAEEAARKVAEDAQIAAAEQLAAAGMKAAAEAVLDAPVVIQRVEVAAPTKAEGVSYRTTYSAEVTDLMTLVKSVAEGKAPLCYLAANDTALNGWARSTKGTDAIPGVRVVTTDSQARR